MTLKKGFTFIFFLSVIILFFRAAPPSKAQDKTREFIIVVSGQTLGELKPCGCAKEEDQGGIERRMSYFKQVRKRNRNVLLLDVGDNFKEPSRQGKIKAEFLLKSMAAMQYDMVAIGEKDFVYGEGFIHGHSETPWSAGNMVFQKKDPLPGYKIKSFPDGSKILILTVMDPNLFPYSSHSGLKILEPKTYLSKMINTLREKEKPDLLVVLSHMKRKRALKLLDMDGIDIVANGHIENENDPINMKPVERANKFFMQPGPRGQKMAELKITINSVGNKTFQHRMARLDSSVKFDPEMVKLYSAYNSEIEDLFLATLAAKRSQSKTKVFATDQTCKTCHSLTHEIWAKSRHGRAYDTLRKVNKAFDPECLVCHTTGFNQAGGFISEVDTGDLKNVQCEVCHGPGKAHAKDPKPGFGIGARNACKKCHVPNHSPRFDFARYWPLIKH